MLALGFTPLSEDLFLATATCTPQFSGSRGKKQENLPWLCFSFSFSPTDAAVPSDEEGLTETLRVGALKSHTQNGIYVCSRQSIRSYRCPTWLLGGQREERIFCHLDTRESIPKRARNEIVPQSCRDQATHGRNDIGNAQIDVLCFLIAMQAFMVARFQGKSAVPVPVSDRKNHGFRSAAQLSIALSTWFCKPTRHQGNKMPVPWIAAQERLRG